MQLVALAWIMGCAAQDASAVRTAPSAGPEPSGPLPRDTGRTDRPPPVETGLIETGGETAETGSPEWALPPRPGTDHPGDVSWRWGGGQGYPDVVDPGWPVVTRVSDVVGLEAALAAAIAGDVVYVEDTATVDLTGRSACVPGGVWLASGRGVGASPGALLFTTAGASTAMIQACGPDVRITGLRLRGPDPETCPPEWPSDCPEDIAGDPNCAYCTTTAYGVSSLGQAGLEVDNNEMSGWTYAAVGVYDALDADIHHNHIHHGWREGLGYGVVIYGSAPTSALVRWNRFDAMRHVVAGQGYPAESYEARDNLVLDAAISHVFDMHGQDEATGDGSPWAGGDVRVHGNRVLVPNHESFVVRGQPQVGAWVYDNDLAPSAGDATSQLHFFGNFFVDVDPAGAAAPNRYGASASSVGILRWCLADGATGPIRYGSASGTPMSDLLVGDLDGDGSDDVFGSDDAAWRWANPDGGSWVGLATSGAALSTLRLADLDGDGTSDVFFADGATWWWSRSGTSSWAALRASAYAGAELGFGDFDGDGQDDVFTTDGARWWAWPGGSGEAIPLATSGVARDDLAFGDFDGDGRTDVFTADGAVWRYARSGAESWRDLATSSARVAELAFVDLDGDRRTDVVSVSGSTLRVSWGAVTSWETVRHQREGLADLRFGDFDGDGRDDVLTGGCL